MITNPWLILIVLLGIEFTLIRLNDHPKTKKYFNFLPHIFWMYFLPMLVSSCGLIDPKSMVYGLISAWCLPAALLLLLIGVHVPSILRLGPVALGVFVAGSFSVLIGMSIAFALFKDIIGPHFWSGFGAITGSWTGGSANMIAVKEALSTPDEVFVPMVVLDAVLPYFWMAFLISLSQWQKKFDQWTGADNKLIEQISKQVTAIASLHQLKWSWLGILKVVGVALAGTLVAKGLTPFFPTVKDVIAPTAWVIIIASFLGLGASLTPLRRLESSGSTKIGYMLLYLVLTSIGAKANISQLHESLYLIAAGVVVIIIHALIMLLLCKLAKIPLSLAAAASQANLGGVASAPVVAEVYQHGFATVGLLLAITGNIIGTYIGILTGQICRWLSQLG